LDLTTGKQLQPARSCRRLLLRLRRVKPVHCRTFVSNVHGATERLILGADFVRKPILCANHLDSEPDDLIDPVMLSGIQIVNSARNALESA
jgi:hypothetical protein